MELKFEEAINEYLEFSKVKLKNSTYEINQRKIKKYILTYFKKWNIYDLTTKDYLKWQMYINSLNFKYNYKSSLHYCFTDFLDLRIISIDDSLVNELFELKKYYIENYKNYNNNFFVFGGNSSIPFTTLERKKNNYCDMANVKRIKIHEFRHSHACLLFTNKIEIENISYRLGHSSISMTMDTYLRYLPRNEKRVISTLNSLRLN